VSDGEEVGRGEGRVLSQSVGSMELFLVLHAAGHCCWHCPEGQRSECARSALQNSRYSDCSQIDWSETAYYGAPSALRVMLGVQFQILGFAILVIWSAVGMQFRHS